MAYTDHLCRSGDGFAACFPGVFLAENPFKRSHIRPFAPLHGVGLLGVTVHRHMLQKQMPMHYANEITPMLIDNERVRHNDRFPTSVFLSTCLVHFSSSSI